MSTVPQTVPVPPELLLALIEAIEDEWPVGHDVHNDAQAARQLLELNGVHVDPSFPCMPRDRFELGKLLRGES